MSWTTATFLFNPIFEKSLEEYVKAYGSICDQVEKRLKKFYCEVVKGSRDYSDTVMKYVQHDFKNKERRNCLKRGLDRLFMDKAMYEQCQFVKHMQLRLLWRHQGPGALTKADKEQIWNMLRRLWLLAQATLTLPPLVCEKMEKMAMARAQAFTIENGSPNIDIKEVAQECKEIVHRVKGPHFAQILNWGQEMAMSAHSPIIDLLPNRYMGMGQRLQELVRDKDYRELIVDTISPLMKSVQAGAQRQGIQLIDGTEEDKEEEEEETSAVSTSAPQIEREYDFENPDYEGLASDPDATEADKQKVDFIIDTIFEVLTKHGGDVREVVANPELLVNVFTNPQHLQKITKTLTTDMGQLRGSERPKAIATKSIP